MEQFHCFFHIYTLFAAILLSAKTEILPKDQSPMNDRTFGCLFIGSGTVAKIVLKDFPLTSHNYLAAVYSRTFENAQKLTKQFGGVAYNSLEVAFMDRNVKAVYVATPVSFHKKYAAAAVKHKLPVFVEKAFAMNTTETAELISLATRSDVYLAEAMWPLFNPLLRSTLSFIKEGGMGSLVNAKISHCSRWYYSRNSIYFKPETGGGVMRTTGVYAVALAYFVFGQKKPVKVTAKATFAPSGVENKCVIFLKFNDGVAKLICSMVHVEKMGMLISGTKKSVHIPIMGLEKIKNPPLFGFSEVADDIIRGQKQNVMITHRATMEIMGIIDQVMKLIKKKKKRSKKKKKWKVRWKEVK